MHHIEPNTISSKVVLVTGASSGIGMEVAIFLSKKGYKVFGTSRKPSKVRETLAFELLKMDLAEPDTILDCVRYILDRCNRIDILVNNAGAGITGAIEETPNEAILQNFQTNYFGTLDVIKAVLPSMRAEKSGIIINITSIAANMGLPFRGIYSASKAALGITTEALRIELKPFSIRVIALALGDFSTNIAAGRYHTPVFENSPYKKSYKKTLKLMDAHVNSGSDPKLVAQKIEKLIEKRKPKVHYTIGLFLQKLAIWLKKLLPSKVFEALLIRHYS